MNCFTNDQLNKITNLIKEIEKLNDIEKLFLYLQLPCGKADFSEGRSLKHNGRSQNSRIISSNSLNSDDDKYLHNLTAKKPDLETTQTYTWILTHLELDPNVSLPKQEVYDEYKTYCQMNQIEPLCVADFGKAMKHTFPCIKPRRLGQRGNSRYCYSGLKKRYQLGPPTLPNLASGIADCVQNSDPTQTFGLQQHTQQISSTHQTNWPQLACCQSDQCHEGPNLISDQTGASNRLAKDSANLADPNNQANMLIMTNAIDSHSQSYNQTNQQQINCRDCDAPFMAESIQYPTKQCVQRPASNFNGLAPISRPRRVDMASGTSQHSPHTISNICAGPQNSSSTMQAQQSSYQSNSSQKAININHYESDVSNQVSMLAIQRTGTPDDDDYLHNYQHIEPTLFTSHQTLPHLSQADQQQQQQQQHHHDQRIRPMTSTSANSTSATATTITTSNYNMYQNQGYDYNQHKPAYQSNTATTQQQHHTCYASSSGAPPIISMPSTCMLNINNSRFDTCASPFQSPASTPYPHMTGPSS